MITTAARSCSPLFAVWLLVLTSLLASLSGAQQCLTLPSSSVCSSVLPYSSVSLNPAFSCLSDSEYVLKQSPTLISLLYDAAPHTQCAPTLASLLCQTAYRPCESNSSTASLPCSSACGTLDVECPVEVQQLIIAPFLSSLPAPLQLPALTACNSSAYNTSASCTAPVIPTSSSSVPAASCLGYTGTICQGVVNYPVYVPATMSVQAVEDELTASLSSALYVAPVANGCRDALLKQMCSLAFLPCDTEALQRATGLPYAYPFPRLPCASVCGGTQWSCGAFLHSYPQLAAAVRCNTSNLLPPFKTCSGAVVPGQPDYPYASTTFAVLTLDNTTSPVSTTCYSPPATVNVTVACPAPLVSAPSTYDQAIMGGSCALPYKSVLWSAADWSTGNKLMLAFSVLSFVSLTVIMLTWTIFPVKRRQHHLHMFMLCQFLISLVFIVSLAETDSQPSNIGLPYPTSPTPVDSTVCVFQSAMLVFVTNAGVFWWTFIAFHLFLKVVLRYRLTTNQNNALTLVYHAVTWLVSLVLTLVGGVAGWYGRSSVVPWCFYRDDSPASADWLLFYIPIGIRGVVGCMLMICVMVGLWKQGRLVTGMRARGGKVGSVRRTVSCCTNMRPLLFVIQFFIIFLFLIVFRAILHFHQPSYVASTTSFVTCLLSAVDPSSCGTKPQLAPTVALLYLIILTTAGQGLVPGVIYLSQSSVWALWSGLLSGDGVDGVSRTRGGMDSSMRTESKVGMSANAMARRMSNKGQSNIGNTADRSIGKSTGHGRKSHASASGAAGSGTTVQASPVSKPITFTGNDEQFNSDRAISPYPTATIETNYAGLRVSRSNSINPPAHAVNPHNWYHSAAAASGGQQPDWSVQLASITPAMYNSLPTAAITRSTFTSVPTMQPVAPVPPMELLNLSISHDATRDMQFSGHMEPQAVPAPGDRSNGGGGVEMAEAQRENVRMDLPVEDVRADDEEYRVTLHVEE